MTLDNSHFFHVRDILAQLLVAALTVHNGRHTVDSFIARRLHVATDLINLTSGGVACEAEHQTGNGRE